MICLSIAGTRGLGWVRGAGSARAEEIPVCDPRSLAGAAGSVQGGGAPSVTLSPQEAGSAAGAAGAGQVSRHLRRGPQLWTQKLRLGRPSLRLGRQRFLSRSLCCSNAAPGTFRTRQAGRLSADLDMRSRPWRGGRRAAR